MTEYSPALNSCPFCRSSNCRMLAGSGIQDFDPPRDTSYAQVECRDCRAQGAMTFEDSLAKAKFQAAHLWNLETLLPGNPLKRAAIYNRGVRSMMGFLALVSFYWLDGIYTGALLIAIAFSLIVGVGFAITAGIRQYRDLRVMRAAREAEA
jgi:hypothetical protein